MTNIQNTNKAKKVLLNSGNESSHLAVLLDGKDLTIQELVQVARNLNVKVKLSEKAQKKMKKSRQWVEQVQQTGEPVVYGINTGFGSKANVSISKEKLRELQRNLIISHAAGTGEPLAIEVVRAAMLLRANTLSGGFSGIRVEVVETLLTMLERGVTPWIPSQGSLGASGDLAPLSHLALVMSKDGKKEPDECSGQAYVYQTESSRWQLMPGDKAMESRQINRIVLEAKEGLALNNGTQISTALLGLAFSDARDLVKLADISMSMSLEAIEGISTAFRPEIHKLRAHPGQIATAENIRKLTHGSRLIDRNYDKVQDAYSLRCHPQVLAGVRDTLKFIESILNIEMNSTNDNPIIIPELAQENKALSGGNFHAQPIAFASDFISIILCEVGSISERRVFRLSDKNLNAGLPSFLISNPGLESGLMIAQYTAASLVSENKSLAHPASIDSIPSCENQEDHVSMAPIAARKARQILNNVQKIVAIEFLYATQALDFRLNNERQKTDVTPEGFFGKGTAAAYNYIRKEVPFVEKDRPLHVDIEKISSMITDGSLLKIVEKVVGKLH